MRVKVVGNVQGITREAIIILEERKIAGARRFYTSKQKEQVTYHLL